MSDGSRKRPLENVYLPACWDDDQTMAGLMSMFKRREVNPNDYDAKLKFWTRQIIDSSQACGSPIVSMKELSSRFRRADRIPAGLKTVLEYMMTTGQVESVSDFSRGSPGWIGWGVDALVKRPISWLLGYGAPDVTDTEVVLLPVVQSMAADILERHEECSEEDPFASSVIDLSSLRRRVKDICKNDRALDMALIHLQKEQQISIGKSSQGDTIIKFREMRESGPTELTETDTNMHSLRTTSKKLEKEIMKLEEQASKLDQEARLQMRQGNKAKAKSVLRQKLSILKKVKEREVSYSNIDTMMMRLAETKEQREILDAYRAGASAFKQTLNRHGMSPDKVDETMEDIQEALDDYNDISMAISQGPSGIGSRIESDAELEQELEDLVNEDVIRRKQKEPTISFPEVPTSVREKEKVDPTDRLAILRQQLQAN